MTGIASQRLACYAMVSVAKNVHASPAIAGGNWH